VKKTEKEKMQVRIRAARQADMPAIRRLVALYPERLVQDKLPPSRHFLVAEVNGNIVSCAAIELIAELRSVATHPDYTGNHFSDALVEESLDRAERRKVRQVVLSTDIPKFFARFGFEINQGSRTAMYLQTGNGQRKHPKQS